MAIYLFYCLSGKREKITFSSTRNMIWAIPIINQELKCMLGKHASPWTSYILMYYYWGRDVPASSFSSGGNPTNYALSRALLGWVILNAAFQKIFLLILLWLETPTYSARLQHPAITHSRSVVLSWLLSALLSAACTFHNERFNKVLLEYFING